MTWQALPCIHGAATSARLRTCSHPRLTGLKVVGPEQCITCFYRNLPIDGNDAPEDGRWPCAFLKSSNHGGINHDLAEILAANMRSHSADRSACRHHAHVTEDPLRCSNCPDYLFPFLSPRTPIDAASRLLQVPGLNHPVGWWTWPAVQEAFRRLTVEAIDGIPSYPGRYSGRGIVIVGGGKYFPSAYITVRVLRNVGCTLPVQLWHLTGEMTSRERNLLEPWDVDCIDGEALAVNHGFPLHGTWWKGWQLKVYAVRHTSFREVLLLDADCYPARDPEFLFSERGFRERGAIFWPDLDSSACLLPEDAPDVFGVPRFPDRPSESGQLLVHKELCWRELNLALFYNQYPDFTYRLLWGDKDTFPIAWRRLGREYHRLWPAASSTPQAVLQYDGQGQVLFVHRASDKFRFPGTEFNSNPHGHALNNRNPALIHEDFCFGVLRELMDAYPDGDNCEGPRR